MLSRGLKNITKREVEIVYNVPLQVPGPVAVRVGRGARQVLNNGPLPDWRGRKRGISDIETCQTWQTGKLSPHKCNDNGESTVRKVWKLQKGSVKYRYSTVSKYLKSDSVMYLYSTLERSRDTPPNINCGKKYLSHVNALPVLSHYAGRRHYPQLAKIAPFLRKWELRGGG